MHILHIVLKIFVMLDNYKFLIKCCNFGINFFHKVNLYHGVLNFYAKQNFQIHIL